MQRMTIQGSISEQATKVGGLPALGTVSSARQRAGQDEEHVESSSREKSSRVCFIWPERGNGQINVAEGFEGFGAERDVQGARVARRWNSRERLETGRVESRIMMAK